MKRKNLCNLGKRVCSIVLCIAMIANLLPIDSLAMEETSAVQSLENLIGPSPEDELEEEAHITAELNEQRTETTKTFRMSNGSYQLVAYDQPVHYENAQGNFEEIDNTFVLAEAASVLSMNGVAESRVYENRAGNTKIMFMERNKTQNVQAEIMAEGMKTSAAVQGADTADGLMASKPLSAVSMEVDGQIVSWYYENMTSGNIEWEERASESHLTEEEQFLAVPQSTSTGVYYDAFPYTDLQYVISPEGIKENIILNDKRAGNVWEMSVDIGEFTASQINNHMIELYDKEENPVMMISAPYMTDAAGKISTDVVLDMTVSDKIMSLTITADKEFLNSSDTFYPVTVDPYFYLIASSEISISDTFLSSSKPSTSMRTNGMAMGSLMVGRESSAYGKTRSLLKLNTLPNLPAGSVITQADLVLKNYYSYSANKSMTVEVRRATGNWTQSGATWNNSNGLYSSEIEDFYVVPQNVSPSNLFDMWEITRLVKGWYEGTITNYGLMLTALEAETAATAYCTKYYSSNCPSYDGLYPTFIITFRNNAGLENYWTYHTQSVNGGTGYTNDYSGNAVFTVPIAQTTGANMATGVTFVYNGYVSDQQYRNSTEGNLNGAGWMTNFGQRLEHIDNMAEYSGIADELSDQGFDYVWLDSDGTHHFFQKQSDGTYKDEDGLGLTLKTGQSYSSYTGLNVIEDKDGNKSAFLSNGSLLYQRNHLDQQILCQYSGSNLASVTDGAGRQITFTYNSSSYITGITSPEGTVNFSYTGNTLTKISFWDGTAINFTYTAVTVGGKTYNLLSSVIGRDGIKILYEYAGSGTAQQRCRVKQVTEYAADGTAGNRLAMDYTLQNCTKFTYYKTSGNVSETYQFNTWGHTKIILGDDGSCKDIHYKIASGSPAKNKVTQIGAGSKYVNNLLKNHSVEEGTSNWYTYSGNSAVTTFSVDTSESFLGYKSLKASQNNASPVNCGWYQDHPVTVGKTYTFSAYVKTDDVIPSGDKAAGIYVELYNGSTKLEGVFGNMWLTGDNDWKRLSVTFTAPSSATKVRVCAGLYKVSGAAWFDCFQLEENDTMSPYNVVEDSSFNDVGKWTCNNSNGVVAGGMAKIIGKPTSNSNVYQRIKIGKAGVALQLYVSVKASAAPIISGSQRRVGVCMGYNYTDGTVEWSEIHINAAVNEWQTITYTFAPKAGSENKVIDYVEVFNMYYKEVNEAYFDNIMLNMDEIGTAFYYDNDGNLITSKDNAQRQMTYTINNATDMITSVTDSTNTAYDYTYDSTNKKQLVAAKEESTGIGFEYTYGTGNNKNNVETVRMGTVGSMTSNKYIETGTEYTENGAYVTTETDQRGKESIYDVNATTGQLASVTDPKGSMISYAYDQTTNNLNTVSSGSSTVAYGYDGASLGNRLKSITTGSSIYNFVYDKWSNLQSVNIGGSRTLVTNTYADANGNLVKSTYGNGHSVEYEYDEYDRITAEKVSNAGGETASYAVKYNYDINGLLARVTDVKNNSEETFAYDISDRLTQYQNPLGDMVYGYDNQDRTTNVVATFDGSKYTTGYEYLSANRPGVTTLPVGKVDRTYDSLQRESVHQVYGDASAAEHLRSETVYLDLTGNRTTDLVSQYNHYVGTSSSKSLLDGYTSFSYTYDDNGNISSITEKDGSQSRSKTYIYDSLNQLVRENDAAQGKTFTYTYDNSGNLLSRKEYAYTTGTLGSIVDTITYTYGDTGWKDLLTKYDGQSITYDAIGNPLTYRDGMSFSWEQGRRLKSTTLSDGTKVSYTYNTEGIRIGKTVGSAETEYFTDASGTIQALKQGNEKLIFMYDATGRREGFQWFTGTTDKGAYYYVYNIQGDVVAIVSEELSPVVYYEYDSWGKLTETSGTKAATVGELNPFRYRGYYYDAETGFYYVSSRYYDPEIGRFLNADGQIANVGGDILGYNMFAYCMNNPVNMSDPTGNWPKWATKLAVAVAVVAVVAVVATVTVATAGAGTAIAAVAVGAAKGAAIGLAVGAATGAASGAISHRVSTGSWQGAGEAALNGMGNGALTGAIGGAITGGLTGGLSYNSTASTSTAGNGFNTFRQLKNNIGSPGVGNEWHHIVEQSQIAKSGFSPQMIQNTNNIMAVSKSTHRAISGYYSSIQPFTNGMIVRNWLAGQSFSAQYQFGLDVIKLFM